MQLNIAVCDDNETDLVKITEQVDLVCSEMNLAARIQPFRSGEEFLASDAVHECKIVFMDIYFDGINGLDAVRAASADSSRNVVFVTTSADHAIEAFNLNAAHYLMKPTNMEDVSEAIRRCIPGLSDEDAEILEIKTGKVTVPVPMKKILFIEVVGKYCVIHTDKDTFQTRSSLALLYKQLDDRIFMKPQQSYIVNMAAIEKFNYDHVLIRGGVNIVLSRKNRASLKEQYQSYLFRLARGRVDRI